MFKGFISKEKMQNCIETLVPTVRATFFPCCLILTTALSGRQNRVIIYSPIIQGRKERPQGLRFWTGTAPNTEPSAASEERVPDCGPSSKPPAPEWGQCKAKPSSHIPSRLIQEGWPLGLPLPPSQAGISPLGQFGRTPVPGPTLLWAGLIGSPLCTADPWDHVGKPLETLVRAAGAAVLIIKNKF